MKTSQAETDRGALGIPITIAGSNLGRRIPLSNQSSAGEGEGSGRIKREIVL